MVNGKQIKVNGDDHSDALNGNGGGQYPPPSPFSTSHSSMSTLRADRYGFLHEEELLFPENHSDGVDRSPSRRSSSNIGYRTASDVRIPKKELQRRKDKEFQRERKWIGMIKRWNTIQEKEKRLLKRRIQKGIPDSIRACIWLETCGVSQKINERQSVEYEKLLIEAESQSFEILDSIDKDVCRTFPQHELFMEGKEAILSRHGIQYPNIDQNLSVATPQHRIFLCNDEADDKIEAKGGRLKNTVLSAFQCQAKQYAPIEESDVKLDDNKKNSELRNENDHEEPTEDSIEPDESIGQTMLRRLLRAYSVYDSSVGYCQGMGFIAATFLTYNSEREAFWQFVSVMNKRPCILRDLFGESMSGSQRVLFIAEKLFQKFLPKLFKHFEKENIHISMFATQWLITIYSSSFPFDLVTRVWDIFMFDGWKIVYRVMLALLKHFSDELLQMDFEHILLFLRKLPRKVDGQQIMEVALSFPIRTKHIDHFSKIWNEQNKS